MEDLQEIQGIASLLLSENEDMQGLGFELVKSLNLYQGVKKALKQRVIEEITKHNPFYKDLKNNISIVDYFLHKDIVKIKNSSLSVGAEGIRFVTSNGDSCNSNCNYEIFPLFQKVELLNKNLEKPLTEKELTIFYKKQKEVTTNPF